MAKSWRDELWDNQPTETESYDARRVRIEQAHERWLAIRELHFKAMDRDWIVNKARKAIIRKVIAGETGPDVTLLDAFDQAMVVIELLSNQVIDLRNERTDRAKADAYVLAQKHSMEHSLGLLFHNIQEELLRAKEHRERRRWWTFWR